jgi:type 1 glutamine amidotransferase
MNLKEAMHARRLVLLASVLLVISLLLLAAPRGFAGDKPSFKALVFSKTAGFRHDAIPEAIAAFRKLGAENNFASDFTEDAGAFNDANLDKYDVVVFLLTTGEVLDPSQRSAFERFIRKGRGYAGIHSASDTGYEWPFYGELVGAYFKHHPQIQSARIRVEDSAHPSTSFLPGVWERTDEWYGFRTNPREKVHVLMTLDESTYRGGEMGGDHPIAWCREFSGGRSWYTALGHTKESYTEPLFLQHMLGGLQWAAGIPLQQTQASATQRCNQH